MKKRNFVYVLSKRDNYELPEFVADTLEELSVLTGFSFNCLYMACVRNSLINNVYQIKKVKTDTFDDVDSFEDYNDFCERLMIKKNLPQSLDLFRAYCFGG